MEYLIEYDTINSGGFAEYDTADSFDAVWVWPWALDILEECCGGHADIFDEDGDFIEDIETES